MDKYPGMDIATNRMVVHNKLSTTSAVFDEKSCSLQNRAINLYALFLAGIARKEVEQFTPPTDSILMLALRYARVYLHRIRVVVALSHMSRIVL